MGYTKDQILAEIRRLAVANGGKPPGSLKLETETGIKQSDWAGRYWVRWSDAVIEAGFDPNEKQQAYEDDWLLNQLALLTSELGHYPVKQELNMKARRSPGFPSVMTFRRFGTKPEMISRLLNFCEGRQEFADVAEMCRTKAGAVKAKAEPDANSTNVVGYVYLMRSGKRYKIGKTESLEKRFAGLSAQVSHELLQVHAMATDDPSGIEAYWHNRFKAARKHGEWFELNADEIAAFKRRKFM